jgi:hypothetical protein
MAFKYVKREAADIEKRASQKGGDFVGLFDDNYVTYKVKKGDNWIRILPPTFEGARHYGMDVHVHFSVGPGRDTVVCNNKTFGKKCAVCDAMARLAAAGDEKEAEELKPKKRVAVWLLDRDDEDKGPQLYAMPWTLDRDIAKLSKDKRTGAIYYLDHPKSGYDINFEKEGDQKLTKYVGISIAREPTSVDPEWLDFIQEHPLDEVLVERTYKEVQDIYTGGMDEEDLDKAERSLKRPSRPSREDPEDDEVPERPARRARRDEPEEEERPVTRRRAAPEPDEDEEEARPARRARRAEPEPEEEDDTPPPRRRASRPEPEPEEEEEEVRPARRATRRAEPEEEDDIPFEPAQRTARRPTRAVEPEPEEEEDDAPPPRRRAAAPAEKEDPRAALKRSLAARNK